MIIRNYSDVDRAAICSLHEQFHFPLPDLAQPEYIAKVIEEDGKIIGLGAVKVTTEGIIMIDQNLPMVSRSKILTGLINDARVTCQRYGIRDMHTFLTEDNAAAFAKTLTRHYGFEPIVGVGLVLRF